MPLDSSVVGMEGHPRTVQITPRRIVAYAAAIADHNPRYFDDTRAEPLVAHPVFGITLDFPLHEPIELAAGLTKAEREQRVHAAQDMIFHRHIRVGDVLTTRGVIVGVEQREPGIYVVFRYDTEDAAGQPVITTFYALLFRGQTCAGPAKWIDRPPAPPSSTASSPGDWSVPVTIPLGLPHIYAECTDVHFAIHTERAFAQRQGLPDILLQGTATLALAGREIVTRECDGNPGRIARLGVRFRGVVVPENTITIRLEERGRATEGELCRFTVLNGASQPAIPGGLVVLRGSLA